MTQQFSKLLINSSLNFRGRIHIHVATQNVNLTLYFLPSHPPQITSKWQLKKIYLTNPWMWQTKMHRPFHPMSIKNYWDFVVSNHGSCFRRTESCFPNCPSFLVLEFFRNRKEFKSFYSEIWKPPATIFLNYSRHFWN